MMRKAGKRTTKKAKDSATGRASALVPQPHGGALRRGNPGPWGGGRPRSEVRAAALQGAAEAVPKLLKILKSQTAKDEAKVSAASALLKYGLGTHVGVTQDEVRQVLQSIREIVEQECDQETAERIRVRIFRLLRP